MEDDYRRRARATSPELQRRTIFLHNLDVCAVILLPAWILLDFGGATLRAVAAAGVLVSYIFHVEFPRRMPYLSVGDNHHSGFGCCMACNIGVWAWTSWNRARSRCSHAYITSGVWVTVAQEWIAEDHSDFAALCERLLFNVSPFSASAVVTWGVAALWGAEPTPFILLFALGFAHCALGRRTPPHSLASYRLNDEASAPCTR